MSCAGSIDAFRVYGPDECSLDGYPRVWHDFGADHPLARTDDATGKRVKFGVKHLVREQSGQRCVRCLHPYVGGGEWTACDDQCTHDGPIRAQSLGGWVEYASTDEAGPLMVLDSVDVQARWRILTVHHLRLGDDAKRDLRWWNLAALCQRCHLQIQGKVVMERIWPWPHSEWFKPYAAGWYAHAYLGEDLTREQTMQRLDDLLALERSVA